MATKEVNLNSSSLPMFHLKRIGSVATKVGVVNIMDFYVETYKVGRDAVWADFYIDSEDRYQSASISRRHARVVRENDNQHRLYDDSLNGVFVNNVKIQDSCVLHEGDKVTFGHPCGARRPAGSRSRQPHSEHQFIFEMCSCEKNTTKMDPASSDKRQDSSFSVKRKCDFNEQDKAPKKQHRDASKPAKPLQDVLRRAKGSLEKIIAKRKNKAELAEEDRTVTCQSANISKATKPLIYSRTGDLALTNMDVNKLLDSCRVVIDKLKRTFDGCQTIQSHRRVQAWRKDLLEVQNKLVFPKTVISVIGDTGAGKSSLINALLDHGSVLPTSGIRACTAVVVEVIENTTSSFFEAEIEVLSKQEWFDELRALIKDLTAVDGTIMKGEPDSASEAYVSYCKIKAVYGKVERFDVLSSFTDVTDLLDKGTIVMKSYDLCEFRSSVEKYIETQDSKGDQYWPLIKRVRLKLPNCNVCSSGAALVDLPGVRDSNAARASIAEEYLKNCTAVWVVSKIHRAVDDKTAKDLLGENFRRQLLMDGQYGSIAFICTKTDDLVPSEIIRSLKLQNETGEHKAEVSKIEKETKDLKLTVSNSTKELRKLQKEVQSLEDEIKELEANLMELNNLLEPTGTETEKREVVKRLTEEIKVKKEEMSDVNNRIYSLQNDKINASQKIMELETKMNIHRNAIAVICARARTEYTKTKIKEDFTAGLRELKRKAGKINSDAGDEDEETLNDVESNAENLRVFCCSATEYQKMKHLLDDGPPQLFSEEDDTEIPSLRQYVHEMTAIRQRQSLERLIRNLGRFVFNVKMSITEGINMDSDDKSCAKDTVNTELKKFDKTISVVLQQLSTDIEGVFDGSIRPKVEEGASNAADEATDTCGKWNAPFIRNTKTKKRLGGLYHTTYKATVMRLGVYSSATDGPVDFNEDLAEPMYRSMAIVWNRAFSITLWEVLDRFKTEIISKLQNLASALVSQLDHLGTPKDLCQRISSLLHVGISNKITEVISSLKELVTKRQRDISRLVTPHVQRSLESVYNECEAQTGPGMFARLKNLMEQGINKHRNTMFNEAARTLMAELIDLEKNIVECAKQVCQSLYQDMRQTYELLWNAPSIAVRTILKQPISEAYASMLKIYRETGMSLPEEEIGDKERMG